MEEFRAGRLVMVVRWVWVPIALRDHYCPGTTTDGIGDGEVSLVDGDGADGGNDHDGHLVDADLGGTGCSVDPW